MRQSILLAGALLAATSLSPAFAQETGVTIVLGEEPDLVEPCMATRSNIGRIVLENISETLTELDVRGDKGLKPRLAESWELVDGNTWRFRLRAGVTFSDGSAFDAEDVKHSFDRARSDQITCEIARYYEGIEITPTVVDDLTIDFADRAGAADPSASSDPAHDRSVRDADRVHPRAGRHRPLRALELGAGAEHHS